MSSLSHIDERGRAQMVDISEKPQTRRRAVAAGRVRMRPETVALIQRQEIAKGDVFAVARTAGILAAKQTAQLIPMCHPLLLTDVRVDLETTPEGVRIEAAVATTGRTGAEMEALTAVSVAALTVYDMCKAVDKTMTLDEIRLLHKEGGKAFTPSSERPSSSGGGRRRSEGAPSDGRQRTPSVGERHAVDVRGAASVTGPSLAA